MRPKLNYSSNMFRLAEQRGTQDPEKVYCWAIAVFIASKMAVGFSFHWRYISESGDRLVLVLISGSAGQEHVLF
jgi:hypothetical protein